MMKRRILDIGCAAVAAAVLVMALQTGWLYAAFITYPKVWTVGEILTSGDLNAQFAAVSAQVNGNLDDTNISGAAAIQGSKLADAPAGVTTTKLNDLAVTTGKIALGATVPSSASVTSLLVPTALGAGEILYGDAALTTRGGPVHADAIITFDCSNLLANAIANITIRIRKDGSAGVADGTIIATGTANPGTVEAGDDTPVTVGFPLLLGALPAGAHRVKLTGQATIVNGMACTPRQLFLTVEENA